MDLQLLAALVIGIATIIVIVLRTRLDAFVALLVAALVTGFVAGAPVTDVLESITNGFGTTLGSIGIVIGLGVGLGKILEVSGGADALARAFVRALGRGREPWAMGTTGAVVSIPVFCDSGFVIMNPLARSIARVKRAGYVTLALSLGCGMTLTHHLVPPTPGPLGVAGILGAEVLAGRRLYGVLLLAGGNDVVAYTLDISLNALTWVLRVALVAGPVAAFLLTRSVCLGLQAHDLERIERGDETGEVRQSVQGGLDEGRRPLSPRERWTLALKESPRPLRLPGPDAGKASRARRLRVALSRWFHGG
ncbi:hypothetical protein [Streptomyces sp. NPDC048845]|uniref:GntP family permease n=1 Tax=Streptomyces sp. NPDC048845 TaxID=3155390 RepID=UPI003419A177